MKPTAPLRYTFILLATTPCRGLSLSRQRRLADLDCFLEERGDVDDRAFVARVNREQRFINRDPFADFFDRCRRKRNVIDYDHAYVATETEAEKGSVCA